MGYYIGMDGHKRYSEMAVMDEGGRIRERRKIVHTEGAIREFLSGFEAGTPVALETIGNWYWMVDEIEAAGCVPHLAHAMRAKVMMGHVDKSDKLDAHGLAKLERLGSLPTVWIPPGELRDQRELPRTRMALSQVRVGLKNRIHATLAKYNLKIDASDAFGKSGRQQMAQVMQRLPAETKRCVLEVLNVLDEVEAQLDRMEQRMLACLKEEAKLKLLISLPGVGRILAMVIDREVGEIERFPCVEKYAGYCGTVPRNSQSGGKRRQYGMRKPCNRYLKWVYIEAAETVVRMHHHPNWREKHVVRLYERLRGHTGHSKAVGAVARHLSEATFWMLKKDQPYQEPKVARGSGQSWGKRDFHMSSKKDEG